MLIALLHAGVLGAALRVQSDSSCPSPAEVSADVQAIVDLSEASAAKVYATLRQEAGSLELDLSTSDGVLLGTRTIAGSHDCTVLARTAAVVLAAWLSDEHPEFLVKLPANTALPEPSAAAPVDATPGAEPVTPSGSSAPAEPLVPVRATLQERPRGKPNGNAGRTHRWAPGVGIGGSASQTQFAPGAWLGLAWAPVQPGLGLRVAIAILGSRSETLQQDQAVRWTRWPLLAGPYLRFGRGSANFEIEAGPALGWLRLSGENFSHNASDAAATLGSYAALRFLPRSERLQAFVMAVPILWFGRSTAHGNNAQGQPIQQDLPAFELLVAAGLQLPL